MASNLFPFDTDVNKDIPATVTFIEPYGQFFISAIVSFQAPSPILIPIDFIDAISGVALALPPTASATVLTTTVTVTGSAFIVGIQGAGDTNANYLLLINSIVKTRHFTNIVKPEVDYAFPGKLRLNFGDVVQLIVYNTGDQTSNYNGAILGIFN